MLSCATWPSSVSLDFPPHDWAYCYCRGRTCEDRTLIHPCSVFAVSHRGVVFFQDQRELVPEDLGNLALRLGELAGKPSDSTLHIHPTQELSENGLPLGKISSTPDKEGRQISFPEKGLTSAGWHTDVSFEPRPSLFTILQMVSRFPPPL